jgi:hypothetical protein
MKNRPKPRVRPVDYYLERCIVARFWRIAKEELREENTNSTELGYAVYITRRFTIEIKYDGKVERAYLPSAQPAG